MDDVKSLRRFLKTDYWLAQRDGGFQTDQDKKVPVPPRQKEYAEDAPLIDLAPINQLSLGRMPLVDVFARRRSRRQFTKEPLRPDELSFLLWATQGVQRTETIYGAARATLRTVPSGGARHPFETYLAVNRVEGFGAGLYRYLPLRHQLVFLKSVDGLNEKVAAACYKQEWIKDAAAVFIWTALPYRTEWRYSFVAAKTIAQDSGHLCQNLYLAAESVGAGACAVGAYYQRELDALIGVDGEDEFVVYVGPVGKV